MKLTIFFGLMITTTLFANTNKKSFTQSKAKKSTEMTMEQLLQNIEKKQTSVPSGDLEIKDTYSIESSKPLKAQGSLVNTIKDDSESYEKTLDIQIKELLKLTKAYKDKSQLADLQLRLADLYVEKSHLLSDRAQDSYDIELKNFQNKLRTTSPKLDLSIPRGLLNKAIAQYETYIINFPSDAKRDAAYFSLAQIYLETAQSEKAIETFKKLVTEYPESALAPESHFEIAESLFDKSWWAKAAAEYAMVKNRLDKSVGVYALYKFAWCSFRLGQPVAAIIDMDKVLTHVKDQRSDGESRKKYNTIRLESEAQNDIILFFSEANNSQKTIDYYRNNSNILDKETNLENVADLLSKKNHADTAFRIYKNLIENNKNSSRSHNWQIKIVRDLFYSKKDVELSNEVLVLVTEYGLKSSWYQSNKNDLQLISKSFEERESLFRSYILRRHQAMQNSRQFQDSAEVFKLYQIYFAEFADSPQVGDMHFLYAELLYDNSKYEASSNEYELVVKNFKTSQYHQKAIQNLVLSREKQLPSTVELQSKLNKQDLEPRPLTPELSKFIEASNIYKDQYQSNERKVELKFKVAQLYYYTNNFSEAEALYKEIIKADAKSKFAEYSSNLLLDIYSLKKDYRGLEKVGNEILKNEEIGKANYSKDIKDVIERSHFKQAEDLEVSQKYTEAVSGYSLFVETYPNSKLVPLALFNSGIILKKSGQMVSSRDAFLKYLKSPSGDAATQYQARSQLVTFYQNSGQFKKAYETYVELLNSKELSNKDKPGFLFNAALMAELDSQSDLAVEYYNKYILVSKKSDEAAEIRFNIAQQHKKNNKHSEAVRYFSLSAQDKLLSADKKAESIYWSLMLSEDYKKDSLVTKASKQILNLYKSSSGEKQQKISSFLAKVKLMKSEKLLEQLVQIKLTDNDEQQQMAVTQKIDLLGQLNKSLNEIINLDSSPEVIASLELLGRANYTLSQDILAAPLPNGITDDLKAVYKTEIEKIAQPFNDKGIESFKLAIQKGVEFSIYNESYISSFKSLCKQSLPDYTCGKEKTKVLANTHWLKSSEAQYKELNKQIESNNQELLFTTLTDNLINNPKDSVSTINLANYYTLNGKFSSAVYLYKNLISNGVKESLIHNNLAAIYYNTNQDYDALLNYKKALELKSDLIAAESGLVSLYANSYDFKSAIKTYEESQNKRKFESLIYTNLGVAYLSVSKIDSAENMFEKSIEKDSVSDIALYNMSLFYIKKLKKPKKAIELLKKLREIKSKEISDEEIAVLENEAQVGT